MSFKTKRLFAVLMVTFMVLAMMPLSVFAIEKGENYGIAASGIVDFDDEVKVGKDGDFTVRFRDGATRVDTWVYFVIKSSRDAEMFAPADDESDDSITYKGDNAWQAVMKADNGDVEFTVTSDVPGKAEITLYKYLDGDDFVGKFDSAEVTFVETDVYEVKFFEASKEKAAADESYKLEVEVTDDNGWEAAGVEVEFFEKKGTGRWRSIGKDTTDRDGEASFTVRHTVADDYYYYIKVDGDTYKVECEEDAEQLVTAEEKVVVTAAAPFSIAADKDSYWFEEGERSVNFVVKDRYGNTYKDNAEVTDIVEATVTNPDGDDDDAEALLDGSKVKVTYDFDEEGKWEVEAFLKGTGISATTVVNIGEFGDVVEIEIEAVEEVLREDGDGTTVTTNLYDENGIKREAALDAIAYSSNRPSVAKVDSDGEVTPEGVGIAVITVVHLSTGLIDSIEITVSGMPVALEADWDIEAGELEGEVTLTYLDEDGNKATLIDDEETNYRIITPSGVDYFDKAEFKAGEATATFMLEADEYGTYAIRVVTDLGISATFSAAFLPPFDMGAEQVIMYIGSTTILVDDEAQEIDVAPFIEEDRTFVPVRFLAEAFAAEADWGPKDGLTEWVTLTREDVTIMINIGEDQMTVTRNGDVEVVELDAPARIVDDRTFLPFRAIGEAFGAEVDYETDEETGLTTSVWFTQ